MSILQLGKFYPPDVGGIEYFMYDLTEELNKNGTQCDVLCSNSEKEYKEEIINGYRVYRTKSYGKFASTSITPQMIFKLREIINNYDIIHIHFPDPIAIFALMIAYNQNIKIITHWHSDIIKQKYLKRFFLPFQNWLLKNSNRIISTSTNYIESSIDLKNYKDKCIAIPSGLNPDRLIVNEKIFNKLKNQYKDKNIIYSFGRMTEYKGFEYLIDSANYLGDDYIILIVGGGNNKKYREMIKLKNLDNKVKLLGRIKDDEVGAYYKLCDVFVLPSITRNEAFGLVQCEAMFFGKPVVSTDIEGSGVSFVNKHNVTGFIVPVKNSEVIAKACKQIINNKNLYNKFSINSKKRFEEMFHIKSITDKIIQVYKEILNDNKN